MDCARVKSALPFHIRENLTGQRFWIWVKVRGKGIDLHLTQKSLSPTLALAKKETQLS